MDKAPYKLWLTPCIKDASAKTKFFGKNHLKEAHTVNLILSCRHEKNRNAGRNNSIEAFTSTKLLHGSRHISYSEKIDPDKWLQKKKKEPEKIFNWLVTQIAENPKWRFHHGFDDLFSSFLINPKGANSGRLPEASHCFQRGAFNLTCSRAAIDTKILASTKTSRVGYLKNHMFQDNSWCCRPSCLVASCLSLSSARIFLLHQ